MDHVNPLAIQPQQNKWKQKGDHISLDMPYSESETLSLW